MKRYSPENEDAGQAEMAAEELEEVKQRLDEQRREQEERLKKEQKGELTLSSNLHGATALHHMSDHE